MIAINDYIMQEKKAFLTLGHRIKNTDVSGVAAQGSQYTKVEVSHPLLLFQIVRRIFRFW